MEPELERTTDYIRASILRALGARLVGIDRATPKRVLTLDVSGIRTVLDAKMAQVARELEAMHDAPSTIDAVNTAIDNTFLGEITAHLSDLKRRT